MQSVVYAVALLVVGTALIGCRNSGDHPTARAQEAIIRVEGAQCDMCAQLITEAVESVEGVESVNVDLEKKVATVVYAPTRTDLATLETAITDAGYNANNAKRNQQAHEALPSCCQ